jgi:uncharacterized membrane protein YtjA (UPF0391 family)
MQKRELARAAREWQPMPQPKPGTPVAETSHDTHGMRTARSVISYQHTIGGGLMLRYAAIFFVIAIIAAVFGFGGIAAGAAEIAKILFFIFIVIFLVTLLMGVVRR